MPDEEINVYGADFWSMIGVCLLMYKLNCPTNCKSLAFSKQCKMVSHKKNNELHHCTSPHTMEYIQKLIE